MNTQPNLFTPAAPDAPAGRQVMNGKPVFTVPAKTVINFESAFEHKLLCDGSTFSTGSACVYKCAFCYVPDLMRKLYATPFMSHVKGKHEDVVVRRENPIEIMRRQLTDRHGRPKFLDPADRRVIYSSPLVDVAGNMELVRETIEACKIILSLTHWQIRLLSKSNLLPKVAEGLDGFCSSDDARKRIIYGVSTGTLDDGLAKAFEEGTPLVSKRIASLHWLQDNGFRTYGMVCPSLPQLDYLGWALDMAAAIRADRCEHVWAEVINLRGDSFTRTVAALESAGCQFQAEKLRKFASDKAAWEDYARLTFWAHVNALPKGKLRFLQYVTPSTRAWWESQAEKGAVVL